MFRGDLYLHPLIKTNCMWLTLAFLLCCNASEKGRDTPRLFFPHPITFTIIPCAFCYNFTKWLTTRQTEQRITNKHTTYTRPENMTDIWDTCHKFYEDFFPCSLVTTCHTARCHIPEDRNRNGSPTLSRIANIMISPKPCVDAELVT